MSFYLKLDNTANIDTKKLSNAIMKIVDLSPKGIVDHLSLKKNQYIQKQAAMVTLVDLLIRMVHSHGKNWI